MTYSARDAERWAAEPPKREGRTQFQRDRARVLHSSALRRLAAKTQVVRAGSGDFPRTRLTHSLECAQVGRELGAAIGCDPDLVDAACLAHDLGHPPFGHNGETALAALADEGGPLACGGFEGNAQSLRLLTRLEPKVTGAGLNLTRATLDAALKYPWTAPARADASAVTAGPTGVTLHLPAKYGAYLSDISVFEWIRDGAPGRHRCLEAQVMDWADDVAYSVHDLEDGLHAGMVSMKNLNDESERTVVATVARTHYCPAAWAVTAAELETAFAEFMRLDCWQFSFDGGPRSLAAAKNLTSELVGRFCLAAQDATRAAAGPGPLTRYAADLVIPRRQLLECALLKAVAANYVMSRQGVVAEQAREREVITELALAMERAAPASLDPVFQPAWHAAETDEDRYRVIIDQVASLTDTSALSWHSRLVLAEADSPGLSSAPRATEHALEAAMATFVIVGGGLAGAKAAETLRAEGFDGEVVLFGEEPELPYERPPLSKGYLLGKDKRESAFVHPAGWYAEHNIDLRTGVAVTAIDPAAHHVAFDGGTLSYDRLLVTTGASARRLDIPGGDLDGVQYLRTIKESEALRAAFTPEARVVIVGTSWIGLETAAAARIAGGSVTVIGLEPGALYNVLGPELGAKFAELHRSHGVTFRFEESAAEFRPAANSGAVGSVVTSSGADLPADVVVVGVGAVPNDALAKSAGLEVDNGIVTDASLRTSDPDIFAAGDVANSYHPLLGRHLRMDHWSNALNGGKAAARSLLGEQVEYNRVPYFYSDQYDLGMECSGLPLPGTYDQIIYRGDSAAFEFIAFWLNSGRLVAGMNVNVWDVADDIQQLIRSGRPLDAARLADQGIPLAEV